MSFPHVARLFPSPRHVAAVWVWVIVAAALGQAQENRIEPQDASPRWIEVVRNLLPEAKSPKDLDKAVATAQKAGAPVTALTEMRFVFFFENEKIILPDAVEPLFAAYLKGWSAHDSFCTATREDAEALCDLMRGVIAKIRNSPDEAIDKFMDALWLNQDIKEEVHGKLISMVERKDEVPDAEKNLRLTMKRALRSAIFNDDIPDLDLQERIEEAIRRLPDYGNAACATVEARLLRALREDDFKSLSPLEPQIAEYLEKWTAEESLFFARRNEAEAFCHLLHAAKARLGGKERETLDHLKRAIKHDVRTYEAVFTQIRKYKNERAPAADKERLSRLAVPMNLRLLSALTGKDAALSEILGNNQALLLDFWASWCRPCLHGMPALRKRGETLPAKGVAVAAVNVEPRDREVKAKEVAANGQMTIPWLLDCKEQPLTRLLDINSIPRAVLLNPAGKILFMGHPEDPELESRLVELTKKPATPAKSQRNEKP